MDETRRDVVQVSAEQSTLAFMIITISTLTFDTLHSLLGPPSLRPLANISCLHMFSAATATAVCSKRCAVLHSTTIFHHHYVSKFTQHSGSGSNYDNDNIRRCRSLLLLLLLKTTTTTIDIMIVN